MLKSMTGFARGSAENDAYEIVVEIRSVNHRYLDLRLSGSSSLAPLEKRVRDRVGAELARGKVEVGFRVKPRSESAYTIDVDLALLTELVERLRDVGRRAGIDGEVDLSALVNFPAAFRVKERDVEESSLWKAMEPAIDEALDALSQMRTAEGAEIAADFAARTETLRQLVDDVDKRAEGSRQTRRDDLQARVGEIVGSSIDPATVAMEVARLVERSDIAEEVTRFRSHLVLWRETVAAGSPCGKKLDFIVQEMNREVNTIGAKAQDAGIAERVIAMKTELERLREQVQNIE
ncbi:MAG TPA: YicC/YloC family endoribonuclease [Vicinamibacteria bacterium]|nr:YicC/YloC family endoribonuclease [Vicinamibacteria bacterium]